MENNHITTLLRVSAWRYL